MITKLALTIALLLAAATAVSAQGTTPPADSGGGGGDTPSTETSKPVAGSTLIYDIELIEVMEVSR